MSERNRTMFADDGVKKSLKPSYAHSEDTIRGKKRKRKQDSASRSHPALTKGSPGAAKSSEKLEHGSSENPKTRTHGSVKPIVTDGRTLAKPNGAHSNLIQKSEALLGFRKELPIWSNANLIKSSLKELQDVLILVGETGSGKSTQVPQFLMNEPWCKGCIAITQPRRVAAISLARRVAEEVGTPLGSSSPASKVGYSVRFDNSTSPSTKIKFLTEGMLLQEMLRDPTLHKYSAVIVDEVHERSVNVDLLLGFLRQLVVKRKSRQGKPLKVVVMSATADVASLVEFFTAGYQDLAVDKDVSNLLINSPPAKPQNPLESEHVASCHISGRLFHVDVTYLSEPTQDFLESALKCVFQIHYKQPLPGDILVFLTGQDAVETLERLINEYADAMGPEVPRVCFQDLSLDTVNMY
jgi:ATP-dependent RNA helicase DHR2